MINNWTNIRLAGLFGLLIIFYFSCSAQTRAPLAVDFVLSDKLDKGYDEYNFWNGNWDVIWSRNVGYDVYEPTNKLRHKIFSALDGKAMIELAYEDSSRTAGFSIRYFDDNLKKWVMFQSWPRKNSTNISSLQGTYHHKRIQLYQQYGRLPIDVRGSPAGTPYITRYTFSDAHPATFRWESSVSLDSMQTWYTRNIAEGTRTQDIDSLFDYNRNWYTYGDGCLCSDSIFQSMKPYLGVWQGRVESPNGEMIKSDKIIRVLKPFLGNCAALGYQISFIGGAVNKEVLFLTYLTNSKEWVFYSLNDKKGESHKTYFSNSLKREVRFTKIDMFDVPSLDPIQKLIWNVNGNKQQIEYGQSSKKGSIEIELKKE